MVSVVCCVVLCCVVWCGVVWCGVVWCGVLCCVVLCCVVMCCVVLCCVAHRLILAVFGLCRAVKDKVELSSWEIKALCNGGYNIVLFVIVIKLNKLISWWKKKKKCTQNKPKPQASKQVKKMSIKNNKSNQQK